MGDDAFRLNGAKLKNINTKCNLGQEFLEENGEEKFKDFLQKPYAKNRLFIDKIIKPAPRSVKVSWVMREFRTADFFGISKDGYLLLVEVKIETPKRNTAKGEKSLMAQIEEDLRKFLDKNGELKPDFKEKCVTYAFGGRKQKYKMEFANGIRDQGVQDTSTFDKAYKKIFGKRKGFKFKGIKVFIIAPTFPKKVSRDLYRLSEKLSPANVKFKYILFDKTFESYPRLYYCRISLSEGV